MYDSSKEPSTYLTIKVVFPICESPTMPTCAMVNLRQHLADHARLPRKQTLMTTEFFSSVPVPAAPVMVVSDPPDVPDGPAVADEVDIDIMILGGQKTEAFVGSSGLERRRCGLPCWGAGRSDSGFRPVGI